MFMDITGIDLFDLIVGMICAKVRLTQMFMDITSIDSFDQNMSMACVKVGLRCS